MNVSPGLIGRVLHGLRGGSAASRRRRGIPAFLLPPALLLSGCALLTPASTPGTTPTPIPIVAGPSIAPASTPTPAPTAEPTARSTGSFDLCTVPGNPGSSYCVTKNGEGAHGGSPLVELPNAIAIDYRVRGSCVFSLGLSTLESTKGLPNLTMTVSGPEIDGTWRALIRPGQYYPVIGEAVGCVYSVNVRDDR